MLVVQRRRDHPTLYSCKCWSWWRWLYELLVRLTDDQGYADVGFTNPSSPFITPNIDGLASRSVRLKNYYVHPTCSPTRAALLTGRLGSNVGISVAFVPGIAAPTLSRDDSPQPPYRKPRRSLTSLPNTGRPAGPDGIQVRPPAHTGNSGELHSLVQELSRR